MSHQTPKAHLFGKGKGKGRAAAITSSNIGIPSSSPAFGTPAHPLKPFAPVTPAKPTILPIILPPATLRPLAFRTFTKKHSLTLASSALQELAGFIGKHCGSGWREEGLAEKVLEEAAKSWKNRNGGVIVEGDNIILKDILKNLEGNMSGGRVMAGRDLSRQNSLMLDAPEKELGIRLGLRPAPLARQDSHGSVGMSNMAIDDDPEEEMDGLLDPRKWVKVVDAFEQPRFTYNVAKKHFEKDNSKPSLLPPVSHKAALFRNRYNVIHQRLLRNEAFQPSSVSTNRPSGEHSLLAPKKAHKITPIANLLGRHGSHHLLLGLLTVSPTGSLTISDITGTISLDLTQATAVPTDGAWFVPGMIVLVDGVYEEEEESVGKTLGSNSGVGGTIGGRFQCFYITQPPTERRKATLGVTGPDGSGASHTIGGGFGWIDFLGVGSERATGSKMRRIEQRIIQRAAAISFSASPPPDGSGDGADDSQQRQDTQTGTQGESQDVSMTATNATERPGRNRIVVIGELHLDNPRTLQALRKILTTYTSEPDGNVPVSFVLTGNFVSHATMARSGGAGAGVGDSAGGGGSIEYKECFDALAATLADFPSLLQSSTFVFVPGDNDGWASAFGAGAAVPLPRKAVPEVFTSRVRRVVATANAEAERESEGAERNKGEIKFVSNPARLSLFGPVYEVVVFRDDIGGRMRRTAVRLMGQQGGGEGEGDGGDDGDDGDDGDGVEGGVMEVDGEGGRGLENEKEKDKDKLPYPVKTARKLVKTLLDQGYLCPFRPQIRPVNWDWAAALQLYPLPTALVLVDTTTPPFAVTYEGCQVVNPGAVLVEGRRGVARWVEYKIGKGGKIRECLF